MDVIVNFIYDVPTLAMCALEMPICLTDALSEMLDGWLHDLDPSWREVFKNTALSFENVDPKLNLYPHEPIFPARKSRSHLGAPDGAHIFRAFDDIRPSDVRCVLLGQDPYPCTAFSTGRAFEVGGYGSWRELETMFTHSMRSFIQCVCAERFQRPELARSTSNWSDVIEAIESAELNIESPTNLVQRWVDQGVLLVNTSLTISRFEVAGDPHQLRGHLPLWRPFVVRLLRYLLADRSKPPVIVLFGEVAMSAYQDAISGFAEPSVMEANRVATKHPAAGDEFLNIGNPLTQCNSILVARGEDPIDW